MKLKVASNTYKSPIKLIGIYREWYIYDTGEIEVLKDLNCSEGSALHPRARLEESKKEFKFI